MQLVFVSNMLNHHQTALCKEFQRNFDEFYFIVTENREAIGYQISQEAEFVLHYYDSSERDKSLKCIQEADIVIFGGCPNELIHMRMKENKLSFLYTERFFKKGVWRRFIPRTRKKIMDRVGCYNDKNMYVLCASAYTSYDLLLVGYEVEKCFKWGYFPEVKYYKNIDNLLIEKESASILWVGRFLGWKHPEAAIYVADYLKKQGYKFRLRMVGSGDLEESLRKQIKDLHLENDVEMLGAMDIKEVRRVMEKSEIFLFTSDFYEGWGAVLNEAMNSGCAVVASHAIGSAPFLIEHEKNGLIYENGKLEDLCLKVRNFLDNPKQREKVGRSAYQAITELWNANEAAERLISLSKNLLKGENVSALYKNGPCSLAGVRKSR